MNNFSRVVVAMDLSPTDPSLIRYLRLLGGNNPNLQVYLVHVAQNLEVPKTVGEMLAVVDKETPLDELYRAEMMREVEVVGDGIGFNIEYDVVEGEVTNQLLHWSRIKEADLILVGKKEMASGSGVSVNRLLRRSECPVLIVPHHDHLRLRRMMIPIDFSEQSKKTMDMALDFARSQVARPKLIPIHVYDIPPEIHHKVMRSPTQFSNMMRHSSEEAFEVFLKQWPDEEGLIEKPVIVENKKYNTAAQLHHYALENEIDLIVIGAKGHGFLSSFLIGSVSEKLAAYNETLPMLVVR